MACSNRESTGRCGHYQCPHSELSGFGCVEIISMFCEVGENCVESCRYSWKKSDRKTAKRAKQLWDMYVKEMNQRCDTKW